MAQALMEREGRPLKVAEIVRALEDMGKMSRDAGPRANYGSVYGILKQSARFRKTGEGAFGLAQPEEKSQRAAENLNSALPKADRLPHAKDGVSSSEHNPHYNDPLPAEAR